MSGSTGPAPSEMEPDELSDLDRLLLDHVEEGQLDSGGSFTVSGEKALEKLAAFQLPRPLAWVSKLVQAAVAGGTSRFRVRQSNGENVFVFEAPSLKWTVAQVESAFYDPQPCPDRALDHFKRGLWPVSVRDKRPFRLALPGASEVLFWDGIRLRRRPAKARPHLELAVSNRSALSGRMDLRAALDAGQMNTEVRKELREHCFTCPIPLWVGEQRYDSLLGCPMHGFSPVSYPMRVSLAQTDLPPLPLAELTLGGYKPINAGASKLNKIFQPEVNVPAQVSLGILVAVTMEVQSLGDASMPTPLRRPSAISWVLDGIVIKREQVSIPYGYVSAGLFISAADLETDLTGFEPVKTPEMDRRRQLACQAASGPIQAVDFSSGSYIRGVLGRAYSLGGVMMVAGLLMWSNSMDPTAGYVMAGSGAFGNLLASVAVNFSAEGAFERSLHRELKSLKLEWRRRYANPYPPGGPP
ncbi:MAG: hypothetical protein U0931_28760 [Vulcanimicrobiota bacterium]